MRFWQNAIWLANGKMEMSTKESLQIPVGDFCGGAQEKSLKSCWWFPGELPFYSGAKFFFILSGEVLVDPAWESWGSCGSWLLLHPPPLLVLPILDLPLLDLLHKEAGTLFHFSLTFQNIEKRGVNFLPLGFLRRLPEHLVQDTR